MIAIDWGSNTIRFIEFDGLNWGKSFEKIVRTAEGLKVTGRIGLAAIERILGAIEEAKTHLDFASQSVIGYTTAAMRMASNSEDVLDEIEQKSGIRFRIIDAQQEAGLTLKAVRYRLKRLDISPEQFVLADIGGGSTELIVCNPLSHEARSLDIGIVTLSESAADALELKQKIGYFEQEVQRVPGIDNSVLVLTAGTPTTIAAYLCGMDYETYDPAPINGFILKRSECERVHAELLEMDESQRIRYVGVGRENLIIAGIMMVCAIYDAMGVSEAIVVDDGLREGIALEYYEGRMP